jgi:hypothetical protein
LGLIFGYNALSGRFPERVGLGFQFPIELFFGILEIIIGSTLAVGHATGLPRMAGRIPPEGVP